MKKLLRLFLLTAMLTAALCVCAFAADDDGFGTPSTQTGITITTSEKTFTVKATGLTNGKQYLLLVLSDANAPSAANIVYIDQAAATNGEVTFTAYPSSLTNATYHVYIVGEGKVFNTSSPAAKVPYKQSYTLGDVDANSSVTANDALYALQIAVKKNVLTNGMQVTAAMESAADVDSNGAVTANDALLILQKAVGKPVF